MGQAGISTDTNDVRVGAWAADYFDNPQAGIELAQSLRLDYLQLFVSTTPFNSDKDYSGSSFSLAASSDQIVALADAAKNAGIDVGLTAWLTPYEDYIKAAAEALIPLAESTGANLLEWDTEDRWDGSDNQQAGVDLVEKLFGGKQLSCPMAVTSNVICDFPKTKLLTEKTSLLVPQAYSIVDDITNKNGEHEKVWDWNPPGVYQTAALAKWKQEFGASSPIRMGLAGWAQSGGPEFTAAQAVQKAFDTTVQLGITDVCYWQLQKIGESENSAVKEFLQNRAGTNGGNPPTPPPSATTYTVRSGDSWWRIAEQQLGDGTRAAELASVNGKTIDDVIHPGEVLQLPK